MKNFLLNNWFKIGLLIAIFIFLFNLKTYFRDKNQIEAKTNRANCFHSAEKINGNTNVCADISTYKIKSEDWFK